MRKVLLLIVFVIPLVNALSFQDFGCESYSCVVQNNLTSCYFINCTEEVNFLVYNYTVNSTNVCQNLTCNDTEIIKTINSTLSSFNTCLVFNESYTKLLESNIKLNYSLDGCLIDYSSLQSELSSCRSNSVSREEYVRLSDDFNRTVSDLNEKLKQSSNMKNILLLILVGCIIYIFSKESQVKEVRKRIELPENVGARALTEAEMREIEKRMGDKSG